MDITRFNSLILPCSSIKSCVLSDYESHLSTPLSQQLHILMAIRHPICQASKYASSSSLARFAAVTTTHPCLSRTWNTQNASRTMATVVPPVTQDATSSKGPTAMVFMNMGGPSTTDEVGGFLSRLFVRTLGTHTKQILTISYRLTRTSFPLAACNPTLALSSPVAARPKFKSSTQPSGVVLPSANGPNTNPPRCARFSIVPLRKQRPTNPMLPFAMPTP